MDPNVASDPLRALLVILVGPFVMVGLDWLVAWRMEYSPFMPNFQVKTYRARWFPRLLFLMALPIFAALNLLAPKAFDDIFLIIFGGAAMLVYMGFVIYDLLKSVVRDPAPPRDSGSA